MEKRTMMKMAKMEMRMEKKKWEMMQMEKCWMK